MTEQEAKTTYDAAKRVHEACIGKLRDIELEYTLALEDWERAQKRFRMAEASRDHARQELSKADTKAKEAYIALGRVQIETRGRVG